MSNTPKPVKRTRYDTRDILRHDMATKSAELATANLRQTMYNARQVYTDTERNFDKAFEDAYCKAYNLLENKDASTH